MRFFVRIIITAVITALACVAVQYYAFDKVNSAVTGGVVGGVVGGMAVGKFTGRKKKS